MMETQQEKLKLEREKVGSAKLEAQATMLKAMNESTNVALAKIKEEAKILQEDMSTMDPLARAWYMMYRDRIGKELMSTQAATAPAMEEPPVMDQLAMEEPPMMD
jgi:hypothetical protein